MIKLIVSRQGHTPPTTPRLRCLFRRATRETLRALAIDEEIEISLMLTDDETIRALNRDFRNQDMATDVLSFAMEEGENCFASHGQLRLLGDIVISRERAASQAESFGHSQTREEVFLFIHGLLHLLGYDHERSVEEEKAMFTLQDRIMKKIANENF